MYVYLGVLVSVKALRLLIFEAPIECLTYQDGCPEGCHNLQVSYTDITFYTSIIILCHLQGIGVSKRNESDIFF